MSIRRKFILGLALLTVVVLCSTLLILRSFNQIAEQRVIANEAIELSLAAQDFNTENFHTQLEVWEYAYAPNQERLEAFQKHAKTFDQLFAKLIQEADSPVALSPGGREILDLLQKQIPALKPTWTRIVSAISEQRSVEDVRSAVFASEDLFDGFHFNKNVDKFVTQQKAFVTAKEEALAATIRLQLGLLVMLSAAMLVAFAIFYWSFSKRVLVPIAQFTAAADAVSRGEEVQVVQVTSKDEVGSLSDAFGRMAAAVRYLLAEAQQNAPSSTTNVAKEA